MAPKLDLVSFFEGIKGDYVGRKLSEILAWSDWELEDCHDYIQSVFPLPEESRFGRNPALVDKELFDAFRSRQELRAALRIAFTRMLAFYGLKWSESSSEMAIVLADNFKSASRFWVHLSDHNHLRITRIIRCLRVLSLEEEASAFFDALKQVAHSSSISRRSILFWARAAQRPLYLAPEVNEADEGKVLGPAFLREFEETRKECL